MKRRDFLGAALGILGAGMIGGPLALVESAEAKPARPNILLVLMDEFRLPPRGYAADQGELEELKEIFSFGPVSVENRFKRFFPGLLRLRRNAVVMRNHYIASAACVPSRTAIMTGQYASVTGVTQTDGLFKTAEEVQFLDPAGVPTIGDWFRAAGYDAKYFGKWHVSHVDPPYDLSPWGFDCWQESGPEPHGADPHNFGTYRDVGFADNAIAFLESKGTCVPTPGKPWLAVMSFVNPHDVSGYPIPYFKPSGGVLEPFGRLTSPQPIPPEGKMSNPDAAGHRVALNPDGFPEESFMASPTQNEDLSSKPSCQHEYAWKMGYAFKAQVLAAANASPYPFQDRGADSDGWTLAYARFYTWLHYLVDLQLRRVLAALDQSPFKDDTIVVFSADHGDYAGAHGQMVQKWHSAYEEATHVPLVFSSRILNPSSSIREIEEPTSHIDLAPTLLGLAGFRGAHLDAVKKRIPGQKVVDFVGTDLSSWIRGGRAVPARSGVLFVTDDEITAPPRGVATPAKARQYEAYLQDVEGARKRGIPLTAGPVCQPNHVRALCSGEWKLVRYIDPDGQAADQWELYNLAHDGAERVNLLDFRSGAVRATVGSLTTRAIEAQRDRMKVELARQEAAKLKSPPG
jgi:arylsulfatase A-like enzyme